MMAIANVEIDLKKVPEGQTIAFEWRGKPLLVKHREAWEIDEGSHQYFPKPFQPFSLFCSYLFFLCSP